MHLLDKAGGLHGNGSKGSVGDCVVKAGLSKTVIFCPKSL